MRRIHRPPRSRRFPWNHCSPPNHRSWSSRRRPWRHSRPNRRSRRYCHPRREHRRFRPSCHRSLPRPARRLRHHRARNGCLGTTEGVHRRRLERTPRAQASVRGLRCTTCGGENSAWQCVGARGLSRGSGNRKAIVRPSFKNSTETQPPRPGHSAKPFRPEKASMCSENARACGADSCDHGHIACTSATDAELDRAGELGGADFRGFFGGLQRGRTARSCRSANARLR